MYAVFLIKRSWKEAEAFCRAMDARLAKIDSENKSSFINTLVSNVNSGFGYWIGLTDAEVENHWKWSDGTPLGSYANWMNGEPNNYNLLLPGEDCVVLSYGGWYDYPCWYSWVKFICEK